MNELSHLLSELRKEKSKSLRQASKDIGISHTYLDSLEKGYDPRTKKERKPTPDVLRKLSDYYNVSYVSLMKLAGYGGKDNPIPSDSFFDLISHKNLEDDLNQSDHLKSIEEYKDLTYPDVKDFLNKNEVYYDKKPLNKDNRMHAIEMLDDLFESLEVNYPKFEDIEKEYDKRIKALEILKNGIQRRKDADNNKEGD